MINAFKAGGDWKTLSGADYSIKVVNKLSDAGEGWFKSLEEALAAKPKAKPKAKAKPEVKEESTHEESTDLLGDK